MALKPFRITDMRALGVLASPTGDVTAPTVPQNVVATAINAGRVDLSWTASTDDFGVSGYQIFRNGSPLNTTSLTSYTDSTCQPSTAYSYVIVAFDAAGNNSAPSTAANATTQANAAPAWQSIPAQVPIVGNAYLLQLTDYCTDADLDSLTFLITSGTLPTGLTLSGTRIQGTPTTGGQTPTVTVQAADQFHQITTTVSFSTKTADVTAPPIPTGLAASAVSSSQIDVSWNASTDGAGSANEQVTGTKDYRVYRDGSLRTTQSGTSYSDTGLAASTQYAYRVSARDNALNESAQATQVTATTLSAAAGSGTIVGSGFGTKSTVTPLKQLFMLNAANGGNYQAAGFDYISSNWTTRTTGTQFSRVDTTNGIGGPSWYNRCIGDQLGFQHCGNNLPAGNTKLYGSMWVKFVKVGSGGSGGGQIKGPRAGNSTDPDPAAKYAGAGFSCSDQWPDVATYPMYGDWVAKVHNPSETVAPDSAIHYGAAPYVYDGNWHLLEWFYEWNGAASGSRNRIWVDKQLYCDWSTIAMGQSGDFRFLTWIPGLTNGFASMTTDFWQSRMHCDNTLARVSRYNPTTGTEIVLTPTSWIDGAVGYSNDPGAILGHTKFLVVNSAGTAQVFN